MTPRRRLAAGRILCLLLLLPLLPGRGPLTAFVSGAESEPAAGPLARILPPETLFFLRIGDREALRAAYERSALFRMTHLPESSAFLDDLADQHEEFVRLAAERGQVDPSLIRALFAGHYSFALIDLRPGKSGVEMSWALAVELPKRLEEKPVFDAIGGVFQRLYEHRRAQLKAAGQPVPPLATNVSRARVKGHQVLQAIVGLGDAPYRFVLLDRTLLWFSGVSDVLEDMLENFDNPLSARTLARQPVYRKTLEGSAYRAGQGFFYLNSARLYTALGALGNPTLTRLLTALGLDSVRALGSANGFHAGDGEGRGGMRQTLYLYAPDERRGILRTLTFVKNPKAEYAAMVLPAEAGGILAARLDLAALYREIPRLVGAVESALGLSARLGLADFAGRQNLFGIPAAEVLEALGDAMVVQPGPAGMLLRFDNADAGRFAAVIQRIETALDARFTRQKVPVERDGNRIVYTIHYLNRMGVPVPAAPSYCVLSAKEDGRATLLVGGHPQALRAVLLHQSEGSLQKAEDYRRVMEGMGNGYGVFLYIDNRDSYIRVWDALLPLLNVWTAAPVFAADPGKLPYGEQLRPYLFGCGIGVKNDPEGVTFTAYSPIGLGGCVTFLLDKLIVGNPATLGVIAAELGRWFAWGPPGTPIPLGGGGASAPAVPSGEPNVPGVPEIGH